MGIELSNGTLKDTRRIETETPLRVIYDQMTKLARAGRVEDSQGGSVGTAQGVGVQHYAQEGSGVVEEQTVCGNAALGDTRGDARGGFVQAGTVQEGIV